MEQGDETSKGEGLDHEDNDIRKYNQFLINTLRDGEPNFFKRTVASSDAFLWKMNEQWRF